MPLSHLQDSTLDSMVAQDILEMEAGLDPVQARNAVLAGGSKRRHVLQVGSALLLAQGFS